MKIVAGDAPALSLSGVIDQHLVAVDVSYVGELAGAFIPGVDSNSDQKGIGL